jgi:hypothetical protein
VSLPAATSIGAGAFAECTTLKTVILPAAQTIGEAAFVFCTALKTVNLPAAQTIGEVAFYGCTALETVSLPAAISIGEYAFGECTALETVSLPAAQSIDFYAFANTGSTALTVTLGDAAPTLGDMMFGYVNEAKAVTVLVPATGSGYGTIPETYSGDDATPNWGNGFRGGGWSQWTDAFAFIDGSKINSNITLTIQYEANE